MTLHLQYAAHSEIGLVRKNNQDSGYASPRLLVVADGMGGAAAGDLASAAAIQQLRKADRADAEARVQGEEMLELLAGSLHQANEKIADLVAADHCLEGMGTTVTAALFDGAQLGLVHIGDSRAYLLRGGDLIRLSHDHSWVQSLVDEGKLTAAEAAYHPHRSLLLKVLNGQAQNDPDTALVDLAEGDRLLFCSDGLCGLVEDEELARILTAEDDRNEVLARLVDAAHREGGIDNITIVVADVVPAEASPEAAAAVVGAAVDRKIPIVPPRAFDGEDATPTQRLDATGDAVPAAVFRSESLNDDEETSRYAPTLRPTRRRMWRVALGMLVVLALLGAGLGAGYGWSRTQYYVGPAADKVAIHRGLAQSVLGFPLSDVYEVHDINLADLPGVYREQVEKTITVRSLDEGRATTAELKVLADRCVEQRRQRANPPAPPPAAAPAPSPAAPPAAAPAPSPAPQPTGEPGVPPTAPGEPGPLIPPGPPTPGSTVEPDFNEVC